MLKTLKLLRELIWPMLEKPKEKKSDDPAKVEIKEDAFVPPPIVINDENLDRCLGIAKDIHGDEEDRRKASDTKAGLLLGTSVIAAAIFTGANGYFIGNQSAGLAAKITLGVSAVVSVYAVATVWFVIKALSMGSYNSVDFTDINTEEKEPAFISKLIGLYWQDTVHNRKVVNDKMSYVILAQEFYRRVIIVIAFYAGSVFIISLLPGKLLFEQKPKVPTAIDSLRNDVKRLDSLYQRLLIPAKPSTRKELKDSSKQDPPRK